MIQTLPDFCLDWIEWFFWGASITMAIATGAAMFYVYADLKAKEQANTKLKADPESGGGFLEAAKVLVDGLSKAPIWLALFFGGLILIWVAANEVPKVCRLPEAAAGSEAPSKGPGAPDSRSDQNTPTTAKSPGTPRKDPESGG